MNIQPATFSKGDWIVHARYGVGQVKGIEKKELEGEKKLFFKVKTFDGVYWLSVAKTNVEYIRPITSEHKLKHTLKILREPPAELPEGHSERSKLIAETLRNPSLDSKARMIRDLNGKQHETKLNFTEEDALLLLRKQFLNEWCVIQNTDRGVLEEKLDKALETSVEKIVETA
jgi:RNA polymerase-interacting CarD/CdnL/TRCF family regulator